MLKSNLYDLDVTGTIGDWCFLEKYTSIAIRYGKTPFEGTVVIPISENPTKNQWKWNGSKELPTLTPSILVKEVPDWNEGWHGFLTDGKLITL